MMYAASLQCSCSELYLWYSVIFMLLLSVLSTWRAPFGIFLFFCFWAILGVWAQGLHLLGRCHTTWVMPPWLSALVIFQIGSHVYSQTRMDHSPICFLHSWDDRCALHQAFIGWDGVSWTFCLSKHRTLILLISTSWVVRITGVIHWHPVPFE
jgi:hypothetical protein